MLFDSANVIAFDYVFIWGDESLLPGGRGGDIEGRKGKGNSTMAEGTGGIGSVTAIKQKPKPEIAFRRKLCHINCKCGTSRNA